MSPFARLNFGGIAIVGRSGSGKSSSLFGSEYVTHVIISDTGSMGHRIYSKRPSNITLINPLNAGKSPIVQVTDAVMAAGKEEEPYVLDSFSTLQEMECAWMKRVARKDDMSLPMHKIAVGNLRDLALTLASTPGFTLFNTSPGGRVRMPDGSYTDIPQGCLTGYPALSGLANGSESILARFTTVLPAFAGVTRETDGTGRKPLRIPRGFIHPEHDFRNDEMRRYCPVKDPMRLLVACENDLPDVPGFVPVHALLPLGQSTVDAMIDSIADDEPTKSKRGKGKGKDKDSDKAPF